MKSLKSSSVFVYHAEMTKRGDPAKYYKMRITSFHKKGEEVWAIGTWFYSSKELSELSLTQRYVPINIAKYNLTQDTVTRNWPLCWAARSSSSRTTSPSLMRQALRV